MGLLAGQRSAYGRFSAEPSHRSQSNVFGTGDEKSGYDGMPCGHVGRFVQACASTTSPRIPEAMISHTRQAFSLVQGVAVTCVATPAFFASSTTR